MPFKTLPRKTATLVFRLMHVSQLFVFQRNFYNRDKMVEIVAELLRLHSFDLFTVNDGEKLISYESFLGGCEDCAIIRVNILGSFKQQPATQALRKLLVSQLDDETNNFSVDSQIVSERRKTSVVDIVISRANSSEEDHQAA